MKKKILFTTILLLIIFLSACTKKEVYNMDQLAPDGKYHYTNQDIGFSVDLGEEFIYYQTQRNDMKSFRQVEFFVPTSDREYPQDIQSYGKFLVIKVFNKKDVGSSEQDGLIILGENSSKTFYGIFWDEAPADWQDKWSNEVKEEIISSFKIN